MLIRTMKIEDIAAVVGIERVAWGESAATVEQIRLRAQTFAEGSIVAQDASGKLVGYASSQLVDQISTKTWAAQTDGGNISKTHIPTGNIAYGVSMSALPEAANHSIGSLIIKYYYQIYVASGRCSLLCLGSRLPGFKRWRSETQGNIKTYLAETFNGYSRDPELRLYQKNGFELLWEIEDYYPDEQSHNFGAMIVQR